MRYERQVVLEMQQGVAPPTNQASGSADAAAPADAKPAAPPVQAKKLPAKLKAAPVRHLTQSFDVPSKAVPQ
jgi:hypothetical protein